MSWDSAGASTAGGIVTLSTGGGYPSSVDGATFSVTITSGLTYYPVNIISCCSSNTISIEMPAVANGTDLTYTMTGPVNTITKTYKALTSATPTATVPTTTFASGSQTITFISSNMGSSTI